jgi:ERF superfamily
MEQTVEKRDKLYEALAKAKLEYRNVTFNRVNSFNKQVYADLDIIQKSTNKALSNNGIVFIQEPRDEDGTTFLYSTLGHASGQEIVCKSRLIVPGYTGAKSDNQRFGESLAYLKRQVTQCMLGVVANNDPEDNDDADTSEIQYHNESRRSLAGDTKSAHVDQGIFTEKITREQLDELYYELQDYPLMTESLKKALEIPSLSDMPKAKYAVQMQNIRKHKISLMNSPKKEW